MEWRGLKYQGYDFSRKYEVSEFGDIRNTVTGRILKQSIHKGYKYVCLSMNKSDGLGQRKLAFIHKAVAYTFVDNPDGVPAVDHLDGDKENNHYLNLEWVTIGENSRRAYAMGLLKTPPKESNVHRKLTDNQVAEIRKLLAVGNLRSGQIAKKFGVTRNTINQIKSGRTHAR